MASGLYSPEWQWSQEMGNCLRGNKQGLGVFACKLTRQVSAPRQARVANEGGTAGGRQKGTDQCWRGQGF